MKPKTVNAGSKLISTGTLPGARANKSGNASGPTGSSRSYPNAGPTNSPKQSDGSRFNPMNGGKSTYGVKGV